MKRLAEAQKAVIHRYRAEGYGYRAIADKLSLSRETVRSFCSRSNAPAARDGYCRKNRLKGAVQIVHTDNDALSGGQSGAAEIKSGNTVFVITTGYSKTASETLEKKLEKLILDDAAKQSKSYQFVQESA